MDMDSASFLTKLKSQNHQAFNQLVQQYHSSLLTVARTIVGDIWAEEVVQEAWVSIFKALPKFQERSSLKTWIYTILKNEAYSRYKKESKTVSLEAQVPDDQQDRTIEDWLSSSFNKGGGWLNSPSGWDLSSPEALLQEEQLQKCIEHTLELLKPDQKSVFLLRDQEQLAMEEVCNILDISHSNARVLLHRARLKLFQVINHYQDTGEC
jgi:RNA polymerase sigma-70 factor (ECF subfamily)